MNVLIVSPRAAVTEVQCAGCGELVALANLDPETGQCEGCAEDYYTDLAAECWALAEVV